MHTRKKQCVEPAVDPSGGPCRLRRGVLRGAACLSGLALVAMLSGCPAPPAPVVLELVNQTPFDVRPNLYTSATATSPDALFAPANLNTRFTDRPFPELRAGETRRIQFECDGLESFGSDHPVLFDGTSLAVLVSDDRVFQRLRVHYQCGDAVRLVFFTEQDALRVRVE